MISSWPPIPPHSFGAQFRGMRIAAGLSLRRAAKLAGLSPSFLTDIEFNRRMPSQLHMQKLAVALGRPVADLLKYDPRETIAELLDCLATHPEITRSLTKICRRIASGTIGVRELDRLAER